MAARFYVYAIHDGDGFPIYIGKGVGSRRQKQSQRFGRPAYVLKRFDSEQRALKYEKRMVSELSPILNKCAGGGGNHSARRRKLHWVVEMERIGTRVYAARELLKFDLRGHLSADRIEAIRKVAATA